MQAQQFLLFLPSSPCGEAKAVGWQQAPTRLSLVDARSHSAALQEPQPGAHLGSLSRRWRGVVQLGPPQRLSFQLCGRSSCMETRSQLLPHN